MKNFLSALIPGFLKRLDKRYLLSNPFMWMTKLHYVLFYGMAGFLLTVGVLFSYPVAEGNLPSFPPVIISVAVLTLIPLGLWFYHQVNFSIERQFGKRTRFLGFKRMLAYLTVASMAVMLPLSAALVLEYRTANSISDEQFAKDMSDLDRASSFIISDQHIARLAEAIITYNINLNEFTVLKVKGGDTETFNHNFSYFGDQYEFQKLERPVHGDAFLCKQYLKDRKSPDRIRENIRLFMDITKRYGHPVELSESELTDAFMAAKNGREDVDSYIMNRSSRTKYEMASTINYISKCKQYKMVLPLRHLPEMLSVLFAFAFGIATLAFIYTSVSLRTFVVSLISFVLLGVISGFAAVLGGEVLHFARSESVFFYSVLMIYGFTLLRSVMAYRKNNFNLLSRVCVVLANMATPFLFIWLAATYDIYGYISDDTYITMLNIGILGYLLIFFAGFRKLYLKADTEPQLR